MYNIFIVSDTKYFFSKFYILIYTKSLIFIIIILYNIRITFFIKNLYFIFLFTKLLSKNIIYIKPNIFIYYLIINNNKI